MDIQSEIAAIQNRMQEIAQGPAPPPPASRPADAFSMMLARELNPQAAVDASSIAVPTVPLNQQLLAQQPAQTGGFLWPAAGPISSPFGARPDPFGGGTEFHPGIDIAAEEGTPIHAAAAGTVVQVGPDGGYGNVVVVDHGNGITSKYAHCSQTFAAVGQTVAAGDPIGAVGSTGRSTGPHLHFEVRVGNKPVDPATFLR